MELNVRIIHKETDGDISRPTLIIANDRGAIVTGCHLFKFVDSFLYNSGERRIQTEVALARFFYVARNSGIISKTANNICVFKK